MFFSSFALLLVASLLVLNYIFKVLRLSSKICSIAGIPLCLVGLGFEDPVAVGDLVMKVSLLFTWLFPFGTYHTLNALGPLYMYLNRHSLLSTHII